MLDFSPFLKIGVTLPTFILSGKIPVFSDKLNYSLEGFSVHCKNFLWHLHVYYHSQGLLKKQFSTLPLSQKMLVIFGRYDSKLVVPCNILAARFVHVFTKKLLNFFAIDFLSVISSLEIIKLLGKKTNLYSKFSNKRFHDFASIFNVNLAFNFFWKYNFFHCFFRFF